MSRIVGLYKGVEDIGKHEDHYTKIGDFSSQGIVATVRSVTGSGATVSYEAKLQQLLPGMILGKNALVTTGNSKVEIMDSYENLFRLDNNSQFCLESTIKGVVPVYFGRVHFEPSYLDIQAQHKYCTSCWTGKSSSVTIEALSNDTDVYYSYERPLEVFEYDEFGQRFTLFHLDAFQKCTIKHKEGSMRNRYEIVSISNCSKDEILRLYDQYKLPFNWKMSNSDTQIQAGVM
ncbi:hypothetical protein O3614_00995 [Streptococcus parasanguinis]|jgi:hypothetical protein|uniref:hypothetical protein n=1 Tax=Streptococcus parasanguinis TaxID=1318 RepID=UPI00352F3661